MGSFELVEVARQALITTLVVTSPVLVVALVVGLLTGFLQAVTQIQDQALSFIPKLFAVLVCAATARPVGHGVLGRVRHDDVLEPKSILTVSLIRESPRTHTIRFANCYSIAEFGPYVRSCCRLHFLRPAILGTPRTSSIANRFRSNPCIFRLGPADGS